MQPASPRPAILYALILCFGLSATGAPDSFADTGQEPRQLGLTVHSSWGSKDVTVKKVRAQSLAEKAGFEVGDLILAVNDKPLSAYSRFELGALFGSPTPLSFDIERDGRRLVIAIE